MKHLIIALLFLLISHSGYCQNYECATKIQIPKITLVYPKNGTPFDRECANVLNKPIKEEWIVETFQRLSEFQALWDKEGTIYLQTALTEVGVPFPYQEMQATLTVCDFTSMSSPLIINAQRFLSTSEKPLALWALSENIFHEVMHTYVRGVYDISPLRQKYAHEPTVILNHLHEMALEKLVLVKLNKPEILQWVDNKYRNRFGPDYKRAWEIVNDIEGYEAFIKELRSMPPTKSVN
jgi:hypothetical protein